LWCEDRESCVIKKLSLTPKHELMNNFITKYANGKNSLILLGLVIVINIFLVIAMGGNPNLQPLDLQFSYSPDRAYELLGAFNETERFCYMITELTLDVLYPLVYGMLLSFILFMLHKNLKIAKLPFDVVIIDYLENIGIVIMLLNYPTKINWLVSLTGIFTTLKWLFLVVILMLILWGLLKKLKK
jgi:hypothetical protein